MVIRESAEPDADGNFPWDAAADESKNIVKVDFSRQLQEHVERVEKERIVAHKFDVSRYMQGGKLIIPRRPWLYGHHYLRGYATATFGQTKRGKSTVILPEAVSMMTGFDLLGVGKARMPRTPLRVWIWSEDDQDEMMRRLYATWLYFGPGVGHIKEVIDPDGVPLRIQTDDGRRILTASEQYSTPLEADAHPYVFPDRFDFSFDDLRANFYFDSARDLPLTIAQFERREGIVKVAVPVVDSMIETIRNERIDVAVIDPFVKTHKVPENDSDMDEVVNAYVKIAHETQCSIELVHHTRKVRSPDSELTSDDGRGSSATLGAVREPRIFNVMSAREAEDWEISADERLSYLRLTADMANFKKGGASSWVYLETVKAVDDSDEKPDEVGVARPWLPPTKKSKDEAERDGDKILAIVKKLLAAGKRISIQQGKADFNLKTLATYLKREHGIKATRAEVTEIFERAKQDGVLSYEKDSHGGSSFKIC